MSRTSRRNGRGSNHDPGADLPLPARQSRSGCVQSGERAYLHECLGVALPYLPPYRALAVQVCCQAPRGLLGRPHDAACPQPRCGARRFLRCLQRGTYAAKDGSGDALSPSAQGLPHNHLEKHRYPCAQGSHVLGAGAWLRTDSRATPRELCPLPGQCLQTSGTGVGSNRVPLQLACHARGRRRACACAREQRRCGGPGRDSPSSSHGWKRGHCHLGAAAAGRTPVHRQAPRGTTSEAVPKEERLAPLEAPAMQEKSVSSPTEEAHPRHRA